jgi:endogenous inhibitor of DNA gyrase (YacG/DUF329 family)
MVRGFFYLSGSKSLCAVAYIGRHGTEKPSERRHGMNKTQAEQISRMRGEGLGYQKVADALGISINTVKSFCRRNSLMAVDGGRCPECGSALIQTEGVKHRRFCSDYCRMAWWNAHPEAMRHGSVRTVACAHCGRAFTAHGSRERKYCSQECYRSARSGR